MKLFSERLRECRRRARLTQKQLAQELSVSRDSVTRWEGGHDVPSARMVVAISKTLNVKMAYLVGLSKTSRRVLITPANEELVEVFNQLSPSAQDALLETAKDALRLEGAVSRRMESKDG